MPWPRNCMWLFSRRQHGLHVCHRAMCGTQMCKASTGLLTCQPLTARHAAAAAGKDYRDSVLKDARSSLIVFAGGDPDLRQAVTDGKVEQVGRMTDYLLELGRVHICTLRTSPWFARAMLRQAVTDGKLEQVGEHTARMRAYSHIHSTFISVCVEKLLLFLRSTTRSCCAMQLWPMRLHMLPHRHMLRYYGIVCVASVCCC
jgi:hypothetical protein